MPARRRMYPDRAPATGISGTAAAYDSCARPSCGHARVKHLTGGACTAPKWHPTAAELAANEYGPGTCSCPAFTESEE